MLKLRKKGQVTIFIIIGLLIVIGIGVFVIIERSVGEINKSKGDFQNVQEFTKDCIKKTAVDSVYYVGSMAGYYEKPLIADTNYVAFYLYNNENLMPSKYRIEEELAKSVDEMLFFCINNFVDFPDFKINSEKVKTQAKIEAGKVIFNVDYPLSISRDNESVYFDESYDVEVLVDLNKVYSAIEEIMQEQMKNKDSLCMSCIDEVAIKHNLYIKLNYLDDSRVLFILKDSNSNIEDKGDFIFNFENKYL